MHKSYVFTAVFLLGACIGFFADAAGRRLAREGLAKQRRSVFIALVSGLVGAILLLRLDASAAFLFAVTAFAFLLVHSLTDMRSGNVYDVVTIAMTAAGIALRLLLGGVPALVNGALGAAFGFCVITAPTLIRREAVGTGDAVLMLGTGVMLGWQMTLLTLYFGFIIGGVFVVPQLLTKNLRAKDAVPLAPFLTAGALVSVCVGEQVFTFLRTPLAWPWVM